MGGYRVSKYDPRLRGPDGAYLVEDWTSASDIGKTVSESEYRRVETNYTFAVRRFLQACGLDSLRVVDLESHPAALDGLPPGIAAETRNHLGFAGSDCAASGEALDWIVRLTLREAIWCRLNGEGGFYVHFGYDYYMYIGSDDLAGAPDMPEGIFAEELSSPYD
jgi:hypothetical protein